jgi:MoaA/NifB/PqqE/SkfB family radical SAM enzyme
MAAPAPRRWQFLPAACDVSVTNACNASCDFCSFARDKHLTGARRWIDRAGLARALPILYRRGIRYVNFQGGEPLMHSEIEGLVGDARAAGMRPAVITNGWLLPEKIQRLIAAGLHTLLVSLDSHSLAEHERNRGLAGLGERIRHGVAIARGAARPAIASVTISRLVDYEALPELLEGLGFDAVTFCYPRREPLASSSLIYGEDCALIAFSDAELIANLDAIEGLRRRFRVMNSRAALEEMRRHIRGVPERFPCVGGRKYFYLDWNLDIWRCEAWPRPLGSVFAFAEIPDCRDRCTACMTACYRDTSVLMHAALAAADAAGALAHGRPHQAARLLIRPSVAQSLGAAAQNLRQLARMA